MTSRDDAGGEIKPKRKKPEDTEMDITPMIDITFLLLSFFVVCSKMDPTAAVELPKAIYGTPISEKDAIVFIVSQGADKDSYQIFKGRGKEDADIVRETDPIAQEEAVSQWVEQQLSARPDVENIMIKAEGQVKTGAVETVKRGIAGSERAATRNIYVGVEESQ